MPQVHRKKDTMRRIIVCGSSNWTNKGLLTEICSLVSPGGLREKVMWISRGKSTGPDLMMFGQKEISSNLLNVDADLCLEFRNIIVHDEDDEIAIRPDVPKIRVWEDGKIFFNKASHLSRDDLKDVVRYLFDMNAKERLIVDNLKLKTERDSSREINQRSLMLIGRNTLAIETLRQWERVAHPVSGEVNMDRNDLSKLIALLEGYE